MDWGKIMVGKMFFIATMCQVLKLIDNLISLEEIIMDSHDTNDNI